jgi:hypothetical protein
MTGEIAKEVGTAHLIEPAPDTFQQNFNSSIFEFRHYLEGHPAFEVNKLVHLAKRVAERRNSWGPHGDAYWDLGQKAVNQGPHVGSRSLDIDDAVRQIENANAWVFVKHVENEPEYRDLMETCICDCFEFSRQKLSSKIKWFEAIIFITSPGRVTPYHIDRECSWLLQISGEKDVHIFDRKDRVVTPEEEIERYWRGKGRGIYKPELESHATVVRLKPGTGVHIPVNFPHWVENLNNVSISLNVNLQFEDNVLANLYRANYFLRRMGLRPSPPDAAPWRNSLKRLMVGGAYWAKDSLKRGSGIRHEISEQKQRIGRLLVERSQAR